MVKLVWKGQALNGLENIANYIATVSERYATLTVKKLFNSVDILKTFLFADKIIKQLNTDNLRKLPQSNDRLIYHLTDDHQLETLTVHNCARLIQNTRNITDLKTE